MAFRTSWMVKGCFSSCLLRLHLRSGWFPPAIPHVETQIFHLLFHKLTFFEFDSEMVFLTNNETFTEEKDMVFLGIRTQTHVIDVGLHFCTPRNQLLC